MRRLSAKQKKHLTVYGRRILQSPAAWHLFKSWNDYETLHQDANRFVNDLEIKDIMKKNKERYGGVF